MKRAIVILALLAASVACGQSPHKPDQGACETAMVREFKNSLATGQKGTEPPQCAGLDDPILRKLAGQAMNEVTSNG